MNPPKLLIDENLSPTIAVALQRDGADVVQLRDRNMNGATDSEVFARAYDEDRIVVTFNVEDFEELARQCNLPSRSMNAKIAIPLGLPAWRTP